MVVTIMVSPAAAGGEVKWPLVTSLILVSRNAELLFFGACTLQPPQLHERAPDKVRSHRLLVERRNHFSILHPMF